MSDVPPDAAQPATLVARVLRETEEGAPSLALLTAVLESAHALPRADLDRILIAIGRAVERERDALSRRRLNAA